MRIDPKVIIRKLRENQGKVRLTARQLSISPATVINWQKKATQGKNLKYLFRKSTRPNKVRDISLNSDTQKKILLLRGHKGFCAIKIKNILKLKEHHSTVHRFLSTYNLIRKTSNYHRPLFQDTKHMHVKNVTTLGKLQMDVKYVTPELSGLDHTCYLYAIMDIFSRFKQGIIYPLLDQGFAIEALKLLIPHFPFKPDFIQTDNGLEFQRRFHDFVIQKLKWQHHYIHKSNPNENAVVERSFRTDEEEFFFYLPKKSKNIFHLNEQYQKYLFEYNHTRPHLSLNCMTPMEKIKSVQ